MYFNMYYMYVDTLSPHPHPTLTTNHNNYLTLGPPTHSINTARLRHRHWTIYLICNHAALWLVGWCWLMMIMLRATPKKGVEDMENTHIQFTRAAGGSFQKKKRKVRSIRKLPLSSWQTLVDLLPSKCHLWTKSTRGVFVHRSTHDPLPETNCSKVRRWISFLAKVFLSGNLSILRDLYAIGSSLVQKNTSWVWE